jgi:hypothetical protein
MKKMTRRQATYLTVGILLLIAAVAFAVRSNSSNKTAVTPQGSAQSSPTPTPSPVAAKTASPKPGSGSVATSTPNAPVSEGATLPAPTGSLLSSAKVSLSGTEESTCATAHGVACYLVIKDSSGAELGRLLVPEVDGNGGHLLDWTVNKTISSVGKYTVSALAVSGAKTAVSGSYDLEVTP